VLQAKILCTAGKNPVLQAKISAGTPAWQSNYNMVALQ